MPVAGIASFTPTSPTSPSRKTGTDQLGKDDFLQLLIAQLRNQDPLKPMEDREFIAQMAQFQTLEQMQKMSAGIDRLMQAQQLTLAGSLIGRTVSAKTGVSGAVTGVAIKDGALSIQVGSGTVALDAVTEVR